MRSARKYRLKTVKNGRGATPLARLWKTRKPLLVLGFPRSTQELHCRSQGMDNYRTSISFQRAVGHELRLRGAWRVTHSARFDDPQKNLKKIQKNSRKSPRRIEFSKKVADSALAWDRGFGYPPLTISHRPH
jgi:hypothetical protein